MRIVYLLIILMGNSWSSRAQNIIIRETDSAKYFSFVRLSGKNSEITRYKESYEVLGNSFYQYMTYWGTSGNDTLYWTNGENIFLCELSKHNKSILVCSNLYWVLEFFVMRDYIYVVYHPSQKDGPHDNRYVKGLKFCRIHIGTWTKEYLHLPPSYNLTNLAISPDGNWASFINTIIAKDIRYQLVLYNISTGNVKIIDSADTKKDEWFGDDDRFNSAIWADANKLIYYKHINDKEGDEMLSFDVKLKSKRTALKPLPQRDFFWFGYYDGYFYFSARQTLYKTKDGIKREPVFVGGNKMANIRSGVVLPG